MKDLMLLVNIIPVEDSFVHLSSKVIRELNIFVNDRHPVCLKVTKIYDGSGPLYMSFSQTPCNSNGNNAFNISYELMTTLGLARSQDLLVTVVDRVYPLERVYVTPVTNDDWNLLVLNNNALQDNTLQQLRIVQKNVIFPIWVSKFIHLKIFIDDLGSDVQFGLLKESTEIVVKPNEQTSNKIHDKNINQNSNNLLELTDAINKNNFNPDTAFQPKFTYRTISVEETLLKSDYIYDYCALISNLHMSIFNNNNPNSHKIFAKISLIPNLDELIQESEKTVKINKNFVIVRLCPLDKNMNNVEKMEIITWPTIYVTNAVSSVLGLKTNSKVDLEIITTIDNDICNVKNIFISPLKKMKNIEKEMLIDCTINRLKNEIVNQGILVLNNSSLLKILYNKIFTIEVVVTFSQINIPYIFLNSYNFGMLNFMYGSANNVPINVDANKNVEIKNIDLNNPKLEYYNLKCFKEMTENGSFCLKLGLQCYSKISQSFFAFDNLLITGSTASGKTSSAKYFCQKFSKCPYFVKIVWIDGRLLAGKLWETVQKQIYKYFQECLYYQPAVIVIDDFDDLCHLYSEPNEHADMSNIYMRPFHLLMRMIENYTSNTNCIRVICTAKPFSQEIENLFSKQFKDVFNTVISVPIIDKESRKFIISKQLNKIKFDKNVDSTFLLDLCEKMESYVIQDLIDYCDKVLFEIFKGGGHNMVLNKTILTEVYEKTIPLSLYNANLFKENKFNFSFLGGLKEAKQIIIETIIWPSIHSDVFSKCPLKIQSGVLLYGAPGTGKTLLARAIVGESNLNFISVNGPELLSKYVGQSEESVRKLFERAQNAKPCIIFFDEFESIAPKRGSDQTGVTDRVVNQFLTQLDGVDTQEGVWVIAATSRPDLIDQALLRPGRIGVKIHCTIPTVNDREDILQVLSDKVLLSDDIDLHSIAVKTNNFTGADLSGLLYSAHSIAEKKLLTEQNDVSTLHDDNSSQVTITTADFLEALKDTKPSLSQIDIDRFEQIHREFSGAKIQNKILVNGVGNNEKQKATIA